MKSANIICQGKLVAREKTMEHTALGYEANEVETLMRYHSLKTTLPPSELFARITLAKGNVVTVKRQLDVSDVPTWEYTVDRHIARNIELSIGKISPAAVSGNRAAISANLSSISGNVATI